MSLVCSCIRLSAGLKQGSKLSVAVWGVIECSTALCVASAPALRPLIFRTSYFSRGSSNRSRSVNVRRTSPKTSKENGTNASHSPLRNDSLEISGGIQVTKVVQVTTANIERGPHSSQSSSDGLFDGPDITHSRQNSRNGSAGRQGTSGLNPHAMGFQAEVVAGGELEIIKGYKHSSVNPV
jgi:hypothetical protein